MLWFLLPELCTASKEKISSYFLWISAADITPKFVSIMVDFSSMEISLPKHAFLKEIMLMYLFIRFTNNTSPVVLHSSSSTTSLQSVLELLMSRGDADVFEETRQMLTEPWLSPNAKMLHGSPYHSYKLGEKLAQLIEEACPIKACVTLKFWLLHMAKARDTLLSSSEGETRKLKSGDQLMPLISLTVLMFLSGCELGDSGTSLSLVKEVQLQTQRILLLAKTKRYLPKGSYEMAEMVKSNSNSPQVVPSKDLTLIAFFLLSPPQAIEWESGLQAIILMSIKSSLQFLSGTSLWSSNFHSQRCADPRPRNTPLGDQAKLDFLPEGRDEDVKIQVKTAGQGWQWKKETVSAPSAIAANKLWMPLKATLLRNWRCSNWF